MRWLRIALQITAHEAIVVNLHFQSGGAGIVDAGDAVLFGEGQNAQNAAHGGFRLPFVQGFGELADMRPGIGRHFQQLHCAERGALRTVFVFDAAATARLTQMLAQKLPGARIEQANVQSVPLDPHHPADPARRHAVVGGFDLDTPVEVNGSLAVLVIAKGLQRQRLEERFLFGEHGRDLPLRGAVNTRVGPTFFPVIEVCLRNFQAVEALTFQRRLLGMADAGFHLAFPVRIPNPARHGDSAIMSEHIPIERIQSGIVNIGFEHTFFQVVGNHNSGRAAQSPKGLLMEFGP